MPRDRVPEQFRQQVARELRRVSFSYCTEFPAWYPQKWSRQNAQRTIEAIKYFMSFRPYSLVEENVTDEIVRARRRRRTVEVRFVRHGHEDDDDPWPRVIHR